MVEERSRYGILRVARSTRDVKSNQNETNKSVAQIRSALGENVLYISSYPVDGRPWKHAMSLVVYPGFVNQSKKDQRIVTRYIYIRYKA